MTTQEVLEDHTTTTPWSWWQSAAAVPDESAPTLPAPIGGARAQSRFSGKSAKPIFASVPLEGAPVTSASRAPPPAPDAARHKAWRLPTRGRTCDGSAPHVESATSSTWQWNIDAWRWEPKGGAAIVGKAEHAIAARRWGDGRDTLGAAVRQQQASAPMHVDCDAPGAAPAKRLRVEGVRNGHGAEAGFASVGGMARQKEALLRSVVLPLRHQALCKHLGVNGSRGVHLHGPPGSGKTHLARALAAEAGVHLQAVNAADCVGSGRPEARLRAAFSSATAAAPCILFIDEIDALVPARAGAGGAAASDTERQAAGLTLALLDALRASGAPVAVVAATNRVEGLDLALRRPGRLDLELSLGAPSDAERLEVLRCATARMPLAPDADLAAVARALRGCMAADVAGVAAEAALRCAAEAAAAAEAAGREGELHSAQFLEGVRVAARHLEAAARRVGPSGLRGVAAEAPEEVGWEEVGGLAAVKAELREMVEWPLTHGDAMRRFGLAPAGGALLYGPPGCGKTLLARAVASRCGANFVSVRGPELLQKWLGESERAVREVFDAARAAAPCVVFFDEIDAVAARRGGGGGGAGAACAGDAAAARVLTQLLCELDGVAARGGVFVLAATNRPAALDPALLRPGRLDRLLKVPLPDAAARERILASALRRCPLAADVNLAAAAAAAAGMSGADVAEVARRAGTQAVREAIAAEAGGAGGSGGGECLQRRHLEAALGGMRRSVSAAEAASHDATERRLLEGGLPSEEEEEEAAAARRAQVGAVAAVVEAACGKQVTGLQARVAALEAALQAAGVALPL
jgi:transitional endoplasmic reticulum ATPase